MHILTRRDVLATAVSLPMAGHWRPATAGATGYTAATAPDAIARKLLADPLISLTAGGSDFRHAINRNFARIVEQHFARRNPQQAAALWSRMTPMDREALAQCYANSTAANGGRAVLLDLLAVRLDGKRLGQVSAHFGFEPVYGAIMRQAQVKAWDFERNADVNSVSRYPGPIYLDTAPATGFKKLGYRRVQFKPTVDMTITQIYQGFRTAPVGGLSVAGALHEASSFIGGKLAWSFFRGYAVGTIISQFLQLVAPNNYMDLGANIAYVVDGVTSILGMGPIPPTLPPVQASQLGNLQQGSAANFNLAPSESWLLSSLGGDYAVNEEWAANLADSGGGGGCPRDGCPIME